MRAFFSPEILRAGAVKGSREEGMDLSSKRRTTKDEADRKRMNLYMLFVEITCENS